MPIKKIQMVTEVRAWGYFTSISLSLSEDSYKCLHAHRDALTRNLIRTSTHTRTRTRTRIHTRTHTHTHTHTYTSTHTHAHAHAHAHANAHTHTHTHTQTLHTHTARRWVASRSETVAPTRPCVCLFVCWFGVFVCAACPRRRAPPRAAVSSAAAASLVRAQLHAHAHYHTSICAAARGDEETGGARSTPKRGRRRREFALYTIRYNSARRVPAALQPASRMYL
jgi:hypothetical protein